MATADAALTLSPLAEALAAHPALAAARGAPGRRHGLGGLWGSSAALAAGLLAADRGRAVVVAPTAEAAEALLLDLSVLFPGRPATLLPVEEEGLSEGPELAANRSERLVALDSLAAPGDGLLVVPGPVLLEALPEADGQRLTLRQGEVVDRDGLLATLVEAGMARAALVAAPGEVSLRGDILDVYPWAATYPVRLELLDDEIEQIRRFEVDDQRSVEVLAEVTLPLGGRPDAPGRRSGRRERRLTDRLPDDACVLVIDPPRLKDRLAEVAFEHDQAPRKIDAALAALAAHPGADLYPLDLGEPDRDLSLGSVGGDLSPQEQRIATWRAQGRQIIVLCDTDAEATRLGEMLTERGCAPGPDLALRPGRLTAGFVFPDDGPVLAHHHELIGRRPVRRRRAQRVIATRALDSLAELHPGDHVVHLTHGVGLYRGMERLSREQGEEDFLVLEFAEETRLYVPASRIDLVERFVGGDARGPKLDRIGGRTWKRRKEKVARAVADLASELLSLAAARGGGEGFAFPPDDPLQARFEAAFPYEDTPDQGTAWAQIRGDMEAGRPMDRLLVGDVGFGKTEVAVRAAFKAVLAGRQVAMLVPTTILAEQHHETFERRMAEEPVRIEVLSRFVGEAAQRGVLADLAAGRVDIVIGTHRLLGKDVRVPQLGLVIVDEEQRFGVAHKERLKQLRSTVDVLTLSATPIPRTLHMALSGMRDIASLQTPPPGRRPVLTKVGYDEDGTLRSAILHETGRGGQVFVLHNRVASIGGVLDRVRRLVPTARVDCAHGQMAPGDLRAIVEAFAGGELDVLVCTSIIESGIDIPRANTIIVTDSHRYGLADLHQLRGRVGREQSQAYAHFLVPRDVSLAGDAGRRLKAIEEYASLGSGLPIALRDLELRGAGNLLGAEQSGHILTVGYDMYCRLLRRAVQGARGQPLDEEPGEIEVELGVTAFLPAEYVPDAAVRMSLLRRMASAGNRKLDALERELADRFGRVPEPALELLALFRLRRMVRLAGISSLLLDGFGGIVISVSDEEAWSVRGPFSREELTTLSPGRWRYALPDSVRTPGQRLAHLLKRFSRRARTRPARRQSSGRAG
jgi:transcription-repair coupling factor (superfamily II helicase)